MSYSETKSVLLLLLLSGCSVFNQPDVERSFRECLAYSGSASYQVSSSLRSAECKR